MNLILLVKSSARLGRIERVTALVLPWLSTVKSGQKSRSDIAVRRDSANGRMLPSSPSSYINQTHQLNLSFHKEIMFLNHKSSKLMHDVFFPSRANFKTPSSPDECLRSYWLSEDFHAYNHIINTSILLPSSL